MSIVPAISATYRVDSIRKPRWCGASLQCDGRMATLGGIVTLDEKSYGLTVKRLYQPEQQDTCEDCDDEHTDDENTDDENTDEELELHNLNDGEDGKDIRIFSLQRSTSIKGSNEGSVPLPDEQQRHLGFRSHITSEMGKWMLLESDVIHGAFNEVISPTHPQSASSKESHLYPEHISEHAPQGEVLIVTPHDVLRAVRSINNSSGVAVQVLSGSFKYGDVGSWVIDRESGNLYGILIGYILGLSIGFLEPARTIFDDILGVWKQLKNTEQASLTLPSRPYS